MSGPNRRHEVPSRADTEQRAADEWEARRERALDVLVGVFVLLGLVLLGWAIHRMGGGWS